jgi:hypothetical protein
MKKIKKFNELFDDERLKSELEIDYLKGTLPNDIVSGKWQYWSKDSEHIEVVIEKLISNGLYQMLLFILKPELGVEINSWEVKESELGPQADKKNLSGEFHMFGLKKGEKDLMLGIKICSSDKFDVLIVFENGEDFNYSKVRRRITFNMLVTHIKNHWLEFLSEFKMPELFEYGKEELKAFSN